MITPTIELPDGSGCFTATILSEEEAVALPLKERPLNHRISSEMYHAMFESIATTWNTGAGNEVFDSEAASKIAVDLCFKIANEAEKWRELSATEVCAGNPAIAGYVASLESRLAASENEPSSATRGEANMPTKQSKSRGAAPANAKRSQQRVDMQWQPIFDSEPSIKMWNDINNAKTVRELKWALYGVCCKLQELEGRVKKLHIDKLRHSAPAEDSNNTKNV